MVKITLVGKPDISRIEKCLSSILSERHGDKITVTLETKGEEHEKAAG